EAAVALTLALERVRQRGPHLVQEPLALVGSERCERRVGRELRPPQRVVGVAAADAGHGALVAQHRVDAAAVVALQDELYELVRIRLGPETRHGSLLARADHPPARLPLR